MQQVRIVVTAGISGWEVTHEAVFATPADFPRHDCSAYSRVHVRRESLGFVHRSGLIFCRAVPTLTLPFATFPSLYAPVAWDECGLLSSPARKKGGGEWRRTAMLLTTHPAAGVARFGGRAAGAHRRRTTTLVERHARAGHTQRRLRRGRLPVALRASPLSVTPACRLAATRPE
jgi:hypothetical protein